METYARNFVLNSGRNGEPVKRVENGCDVVGFPDLTH
jgi:hypothetical protein